jgi:hypothetical protein
VQLHREGAVLDEAEPQRLARDGLLDLQLVEGLGDRGRADHLAADAIAQLGGVERERHPALDRRQPGLGQHVGHRVRHAEVGRHGAVEDAVEDAEHVGGGAADVDADHVDLVALGQRRDDEAHRARGRHDRRVGPAHQLAVARRLGHHVLHEHVVDGVAGRRQVLGLERRPQVVDELQRDPALEDGPHVAAHRAVAGVDHRQIEAGAQPRPGLGRAQELGDRDDVLAGAAVGAAGQEDHVGPQLADALDLLVRQPAVVDRDRVHDDRAGTERGAGGALGGHVLDDAGHHHLQAAAGRAGRDVQIGADAVLLGADDARAVGAVRVRGRAVGQELPAAQLLDLAHGVEHAAGDVLDRRLDGGRRLAARGQAVLAGGVPLDQDRLGRGRPAVGRDHRADRRRIDRGAGGRVRGHEAPL